MNALDLLDRIDPGMLARELYPHTFPTAEGADRKRLLDRCQRHLDAIRRLAAELADDEPAHVGREPGDVL